MKDRDIEALTIKLQSSYTAAPISNKGNNIFESFLVS